MEAPYDEQGIYDGLRSILIEAMRIDPEKITPQSRLFSDLGAESLDILDIRFRIQEMFGFQISDGEVIRRLGNNLTTQQIDDKFTVRSLMDYIQERLSSKGDR